MNNKGSSYLRSHNLVNRIYDILYYFNFFDFRYKDEYIKNRLKSNLKDISFVETLLKYFEGKLRSNRKNVETRINLTDLIYDLNTYKQYLNY